jgi:hypothetical protein
MRRLSLTIVAALAVGGACAHEQLPRPPGPADLARINETAEANHWFRVEYVEPLAAESNAHVARPIGIDSADAGEIGFRTWRDTVELVPTEMVNGVTVKERGSGVAAGAGLGLAAGVVFVGALLAAKYAFLGDIWATQPSCRNCVAKGIAGGLLLPTLIGGIAGYFVGYRKTFDFGRIR